MIYTYLYLHYHIYFVVLQPMHTQNIMSLDDRYYYINLPISYTILMRVQSSS